MLVINGCDEMSKGDRLPVEKWRNLYGKIFSGLETLQRFCAVGYFVATLLQCLDGLVDIGCCATGVFIVHSLQSSGMYCLKWGGGGVI